MSLTPPTVPIVAPQIDLPLWAHDQINLANPRLGAAALFASDDFFAPLERLLNPEPAVFVPGLYDDHGKWMDGWETRRKRSTGHDHGIIRLGRRGLIRGVCIDTSHFTGNYAPAASIDAVDMEPTAALATLHEAPWHEILPAVTLQGNRQHYIELPPSEQTTPWSHLRLSIYPDGGIARLRVYGQPRVDLTAAGPLLDLAAMENGGRAIAWNDAHFGAPQNMLLPGKGLHMGDGWETRRRREPGADWCIVQLAGAGKVERIEVDTAFFKGNFPDRCSIQAARVVGGTDQSLVSQSMFWPLLLPEQALAMDSLRVFDREILNHDAITHIRFTIIPDGGVSRLRLFGKLV